MRFSRLAAIAGAGRARARDRVMFFHRRQAPGDTAGGWAPDRRTPRGDGRDDHPRGAGRLVLGPDPQGRAGRGRQGQHRAALLQRSRGAEPGQPGAERDRQRRRRNRRDAGQAGRDGARRQGRDGQGHSGRRVQLGLRQLEGRWASRSTSVRTRSSPAVAAGERLQRRRRQEGRSASSRSRARSHSSPAAPVSKQGFKGAAEILNVNSKDMPSVESTITAKLQQDQSIDHVVTLGAPIALTAVQSVEERRQHTPRSSPSTPTPRSSTRSRTATCSGPSTSSRSCRATSPIDSLWLYINNKNVIGGGQADADRPVVHRQDQHRLGRRVGQVRNPLSARATERATT